MADENENTTARDGVVRAYSEQAKNYQGTLTASHLRRLLVVIQDDVKEGNLDRAAVVLLGMLGGEPTNGTSAAGWARKITSQMEGLVDAKMSHLTERVDDIEVAIQTEDHRRRHQEEPPTDSSVASCPRCRSLNINQRALGPPRAKCVDCGHDATWGEFQNLAGAGQPLGVITDADEAAESRLYIAIRPDFAGNLEDLANKFGDSGFIERLDDKTIASAAYGVVCAWRKAKADDASQPD